LKIIALYPGSFDPIHYGHIDIAMRAAALFDELIIGVYDRPLKTLAFSSEERLALVCEAVAGMKLANVKATLFGGLAVEYCHAVGAKVMVRGLRVFSDFEHEFRMALANRRLAPDIDTVQLITNEEHTFISSSTVREIASLSGDISSLVPPFVEVALKRRFYELGPEGQKVAQMTTFRD
jgi:pantetheine-phosphate adenylyltransferase